MKKGYILLHKLILVTIFILSFAVILSVVIYSIDLHKASYKVSEAKAYETITLNVNDPVIAVTKVDIVPKKTIFNAELSVEKVDSVPRSLDNAYQYLYIYSTIKDIDIARIDINFRVLKSYLRENNSSKEYVSLQRLYKDVWTKVKSSYINEDENYYYYKGDSAGLSYFAITAEKAPVLITQQVEKQPVTEAPVKENITREISERKGKLPIFFWFLVIFAIGVIILFVYLIIPKKIMSEKPSFAPNPFVSYLHLKSGLVVSNIKELKKALQYMEDEDFKYHKESKDIENWLVSMNRQDLASLISKANSVKEMLEVLEKDEGKKASV